MADLKTVEERIRELKEEMKPIVKEIEALERIATGLRALDRGESVTRVGMRDFSELTVPEAAEQILIENAGRLLHYTEITDIAFKRGFKGKRTAKNAPREKIAASFRRMMGQRPDIFEAGGRGMYRVKEEYLQQQEGGMKQ
jgi:hypothetical protein